MALKFFDFNLGLLNFSDSKEILLKPVMLVGFLYPLLLLASSPSPKLDKPTKVATMTKIANMSSIILNFRDFTLNEPIELNVIDLHNFLVKGRQLPARKRSDEIFQAAMPQDQIERQLSQPNQTRATSSFLKRIMELVRTRN